MSIVLHANESPRSNTQFLEYEDRFRIIFNSVNDGIFISDPSTGKFIDINDPGCRMFGYHKSDLLGRDVDTLSSGIHPHTTDMAIELNEKARLGEPQIFEWQCKNKDGTLFWTEISLRYSKFGETSAIVAIIRDIAERKALDAEILYLAQHDVLTGLSNRIMFVSALEQSIAQSLRSGKKFAILSVDLDHFKVVNDTWGHSSGDRLLRLVAARLKSVVRSNEPVARFGGDEFALLLSDVSEPSEIAVLAERLIASIKKPFLIDRIKCHVGASIGVAIFDEVTCDAETLLSHADIALYRAKAEGGATYRFFSDSMNEEVRERIALTEEFRLAMPAEQLFLVYQPQVRTRTGQIIGVEALVRWRHPRRGILNPEDFLPIAENSGLIEQLGHWVLREACEQGRQWMNAGILPGTIAVNVSTSEFKEPLAFEKRVFAVLADTQLPPGVLELEITEKTLINLSTQHEEVVQRLRAAGVRFSLDDFGTGYSSLNYLRRFSVDRIKIAQEFICDMVISEEAAAIVKLILGLGKNFGNEVIAEGVETSEQLNLLKELDCPEVQGFYFSHPMSAEAIALILSAGKISPSKPSVGLAAA